MKVDNAIIMAAGTASRFAPLSYETHKALIEVKGEILIERQIRQLIEAGITEIIVITGYMANRFSYLAEKYGVKLVHNNEYLYKNNVSSIYAVRDKLKNTIICSSDNYYYENPFTRSFEESSYSAVYASGITDEWCIKDKEGWIDDVSIGGVDSWIMLGYSFWTEAFSKRFSLILTDEYNRPETANKLWESLYVEHIKELPMKVIKYDAGMIFEFDTLDELREFDHSYINDSRSSILKQISKELAVPESEIRDLEVYKDRDNRSAGFTFVAGKKYQYNYSLKKLEEVLC